MLLHMNYTLLTCCYACVSHGNCTHRLVVQSVTPFHVRVSLSHAYIYIYTISGLICILLAGQLLMRFPRAFETQTVRTIFRSRFQRGSWCSFLNINRQFSYFYFVQNRFILEMEDDCSRSKSVKPPPPQIIIIILLPTACLLRSQSIWLRFKRSWVGPLWGII